MSEHKYFDSDHADVLCTGENRFSDLLVPSTQGAGASEVTGRGIVVTRIQTRVRIKLPSTTSGDDTSDLFRLTLVLDTQSDTDTLDGGYLNNGGSVAVPGEWFGHQDPAQMGRFKYLFDEDHKLNIPSGGPGSSASGEDNAFSVVDLPVYIPIDYKDFGGGTIRPRGNALYLVGTTAHDHCFWQSGVRVWYFDQ